MAQTIVAGAAVLATFAFGVSGALPRAVAGANANPSARQLWTARYDGQGGSGTEGARAAGVSPDGAMVFVTGVAGVGGGQVAYATLAYRASTGRRLWKAFYDGGFGYNRAWDLVVGQDGSVFVTGESMGPNGLAFGTVAYRASDGLQRWSAQYAGGTGDNRAYAIAASPDGSTVFVTGPSDRHRGRTDYATVAYDAATGSQLWVSLYDGPSHDYDIAQAIAVSPDGTKVFVAGNSEGRHGLKYDYGTVAYDAQTGRTLWTKRYTGPPHSVNDATAVAVSPDGSAVFVTGDSAPEAGADIVTVAYDASSGAVLWSARYKGPMREGDAVAVVATPDVVFVAGSEQNADASTAFVTLAYDPATGREQWANLDVGLGASSAAAAAAVSPNGSTIYVTGTSDADDMTAAYAAGTGERLWKVRDDGPDHQDDGATAIAVAPGGATVFVTGESGPDYLTAAYRAT